MLAYYLSHYVSSENRNIHESYQHHNPALNSHNRLHFEQLTGHRPEKDRDTVEGLQ